MNGAGLASLLMRIQISYMILALSRSSSQLPGSFRRLLNQMALPESKRGWSPKPHWLPQSIKGCSNSPFCFAVAPSLRRANDKRVAVRNFQGAQSFAAIPLILIWLLARGRAFLQAEKTGRWARTHGERERYGSTCPRELLEAFMLIQKRACVWWKRFSNGKEFHLRLGGGTEVFGQEYDGGTAGDGICALDWNRKAKLWGRLRALSLNAECHRVWAMPSHRSWSILWSRMIKRELRGFTNKMMNYHVCSFGLPLVVFGHKHSWTFTVTQSLRCPSAVFPCLVWYCHTTVAQ